MYIYISNLPFDMPLLFGFYNLTARFYIYRSERYWSLVLNGRKHVSCRQRQTPLWSVSENGSTSMLEAKLIGEANSVALFPLRRLETS